MKNKAMVDEAINMFIAASFSIGMLCLWLSFCHMVYQVLCRNSCVQNNLVSHLDRTEAVLVTDKPPETSECQQEDRIFNMLLADNNSFIN